MKKKSRVVSRQEIKIKTQARLMVRIWDPRSKRQRLLRGVSIPFQIKGDLADELDRGVAILNDDLIKFIVGISDLRNKLGFEKVYE